MDTNVLISALISEGKPRVLLRRIVLNEFVMVTSDLLIEEFENVIHRSKFRVNEEQISREIYALMQVAEVVAVVSKFDVVERDFKDNMVLETAYDGKADFIVSGDDYLLTLKSFRGIKIVSVKEILDYLEENQV
ncbi:MAG: putative toxin-antitoxin system toxin component, PIN family [Candidatus Bathyarchaeota archaeon]|uniref:putative toxin-antitoxin system toxin component, PIN family n=1 Tax=Candidatus Bathycorpusculum sp. TaxID=2994959 RepID=UPI002823903F|nr:putative toxin-antitoxin system toxin component, PIN family [Candidatus Termiticorpusculum sp.]MCL2258147.1 putative toxin-antitoxin system toxin component, PIN family [Candidatus Termiticorpusculum sp.]MCL2291569.1 putative toxin-antitoxin system toxin component, PIN family [Candidatus Termiticorpusculum sp.]